MSSNEYQKDYSRDHVKSDDNRDSINSKDFMIGALIGGIVGAAAALFLAPKSGRELRSDINEGARYLSDKTEKMRQTAVEKGSEFAEVAKVKTSQITDSVSKQSAVLKENVKNLRRKNSVEQNPVDLVADQLTVDETISLDEAKQILEETEQAFIETEKQLTKQ